MPPSKVNEMAIHCEQLASDGVYGARKTPDAAYSTERRVALLRLRRILLSTLGPGSEAGQHVLIGALAGDDHETVKLALAEGLEVNQYLFNGETPVFRAAMAGSVRTIHLLLQAGADPHIPTVYNRPSGHRSITPIEMVRQRLTVEQDPQQQQALKRSLELIAGNDRSPVK